jgi:hypothetical protein
VSSALATAPRTIASWPSWPSATRGPSGVSSAKASLERRAQEVDVAADAAAEQDELGIEDRGDGSDDQRQAFAFGLDGGQDQLVARARRPRLLRAINTGGVLLAAVALDALARERRRAHGRI